MDVDVGIDPIVVICGTDDHYVRPLAVTLYTALLHLEPGTSLKIYVMDGGISSEKKERLRRVLQPNHINISLEFINPGVAIEEVFDTSDLAPRKYISSAALLRVLAPNLIDHSLKKAIYLDCDLLILASLKPLWDEELGDASVLAVRDSVSPYFSSPLGIAKYEELGLPGDAPYFNSGVLVMNLPKWREDEVGKKAISYLQEYREFRNANDQEGLNVVLTEKWRALDSRWNVMPHMYRFDRWRESAYKEELRAEWQSIIDEAKVHHYAGSTKPWHIACPYPTQLLWVRYLRQCGWFSFPEKVRWLGEWYARLLLHRLKDKSELVSRLAAWVRKKWPSMQYKYNAGSVTSRQ